MFKVVDAYLYKPSSVVLRKSDIANAKDNEFEPVRLFVRTDDIKQWHDESEAVEIDEEEIR